ncbi:cuticle protein 38-like [Musca vetustissima]|uniref:cuticle protein 38-like n=1 Tax=Musca vetustissima TaxID=27455 RepID=UPI002AB6E7BF|nr:cuticle protein 38-like [Musca vetustissima]XP_061402337.1 cuticle protein 38-like [Musca vetustissima]
MFKLIAVFSALFAVASAGYLGGYGHGVALSAPAYATSYHAVAAPVVHAAPIYKSYAAPVAVAAPVVKAYAPVATSYANTYKVSAKAIPVVHAAPAVVAAPVYKSYAAPAVVAAPAYGYGYHHGLASYGHSVYH